jgi:hypothetical protein
MLSARKAMRYWYRGNLHPIPPVGELLAPGCRHAATVSQKESQARQFCLGSLRDVRNTHLVTVESYHWLDGEKGAASCEAKTTPKRCLIRHLSTLPTFTSGEEQTSGMTRLGELAGTPSRIAFPEGDDTITNHIARRHSHGVA